MWIYLCISNQTRQRHVHKKLMADRCPDFAAEQELKDAKTNRDKGIQTVTITYAVYQLLVVIPKIPRGDRKDACDKLKKDMSAKEVSIPPCIDDKIKNVLKM